MPFPYLNGREFLEGGEMDRSVIDFGDANSLTANLSDGSKQTRATLQLDPETSRSVFAREGRVQSILVTIDPTAHLDWLA